jgi:hypothetical protein
MRRLPIALTLLIAGVLGPSSFDGARGSGTTGYTQVTSLPGYANGYRYIGVETSPLEGNLLCLAYPQLE